MKLFDIEPKNTHNALVDILICLRCFCKMELKLDVSEKNRTIQQIQRTERAFMKVLGKAHEG